MVDDLIAVLNEDTQMQAGLYKPSFLANFGVFVRYLGTRLTQQIIDDMKTKPEYFRRLRQLFSEVMLRDSQDWFLGRFTVFRRDEFVSAPDTFARVLERERLLGSS